MELSLGEYLYTRGYTIWSTADSVTSGNQYTTVVIFYIHNKREQQKVKENIALV